MEIIDSQKKKKYPKIRNFWFFWSSFSSSFYSIYFYFYLIQIKNKNKIKITLIQKEKEKKEERKNKPFVNQLSKPITKKQYNQKELAFF